MSTMSKKHFNNLCNKVERRLHRIEGTKTAFFINQTVFHKRTLLSSLDFPFQLEKLADFGSWMSSLSVSLQLIGPLGRMSIDHEDQAAQGKITNTRYMCILYQLPQLLCVFKILQTAPSMQLSQ